MKPDDLNGIYKDFAENFGLEITTLIYENYKGLQVTFPLKFLSSEYVNECIVKQYNGKNIKELARQFQCSERKIRNVLSENNLTKKDK